MNRRQQTDLLQRQTPVTHTFSLLLYRYSALALAFCLLALPLGAKVTNSIASGSWSAPATWDNGVPADGDQITISAPHTVTLSANVNFIAVASTLTVNGTLDLGTFSCRVTTTTVAAGATVIQNTGSGLPVPANLLATTLTLNATSNYSYTGNPTGFTGIHPVYGNLSYASTAAGNGTFDVNLKVAGNMTINNPGAGEIRFGSGANHSHTIGGTLNIAAGNAVGTNGAANVAIDINGNLTIGNTATFKACAAAGNLTVNLAGNFTQNGALTSPGAGVFNLIFDGATTSNIGGAAALTLPNVTMSKAAGFHAVLAQHLTISKNLNFLSGKIQIGNFNLTQAPGASVTGYSGATGFVETNGTGKFISSQASPGATFPVGVGSYTPLALIPTLSTTAFGVRVVDGLSAEIPGCSGFVTDDGVKKMWIVTRESGTGTITDITLNWNGSDEGSTFNRSLCYVSRYLGGDWESLVPNAATGTDPYQRGRVFGLASTVFEGTFGVLDNSASLNLTAPSGVSNSPVCEGDTLNLQRTSVAVSGAAYQWSKLGGGFNPPAGPNASIKTVQVSDAGNYLLTMSKYGCNYTSTAVPVIVNTLPVCAIGDAMEVCSNTNGHVYSAPIGLTVYAWTISGNGSISGPSNGSQVTVNAGAAGTFTLSLTVTNSNGCSSSCSMEVTVMPRPTGVLSGSTTICAGESAELSIDVTGSGPWSGTLSDGTAFNGSDSPVTVTVTPAMNTTYTLATLSDENCTATPNDLSGSATVTIDVLQNFEVTGGGEYCAGGEGVEIGLSGSENGVSYQLLLDGDPYGDPVAGTGGAISFGNQTSEGTYTVVATRDITDCTATMSGSVAVTILPLPVVTLVLGIDQTTVLGGNVPLTGGNPPGGEYSGPGVSGGVLDPFLAGIGLHTITYTYTDENGCSNSATDQFTVLPEDGLNLLVESPDSAECGDKFTIDIVAVGGFTDIGTLQFSVAWDSLLFMYMGNEPTVIDGTAPLVELYKGRVVYSWLDENDTPYSVSLPDDTVLLRLTFKTLKCTGSGKITIEDIPRVIEASGEFLNVIPVTILNTNEITLKDTQAPQFSDVPSNISVECSAVPDPGQPAATDNCDDEVTVTYEGQTITPGICAGNYTITRTWRATDDCQNTTTTTQVITVHDTTPPTFTEPADMTLNLDANCEYDASAANAGGISNAADNCSPVDSLHANYTDEVSTGPGSKVVITRSWTLTDDCGNTSSGQIQVITIIDNTPPTIVCPQNETVIPGNSECLFIIDSTEFDPQTSDNCGVEGIDYILTGATEGFGSGSLDGVQLPVGVTFVAWVATDINGNTAFCSFAITVEDCSGLSGQLIWEGDDVSGVAQATVVLSGDASDTDGPTLGDGLYELVGGSTGNFVITPSKPTPPADPLNGITAADALAIQKHLINSPPITDPYKLIAADVNLSNSVTSADASIIRQAILGSPTAIEILSSHPWRFVPTPDPGPGFPGYIPPLNPFSAPIPSSRILTGVSGGATNQNFFGIKIGDVNGSADPVLHPDDAEALTWIVEDRTLVAGQDVVAVFRASHFLQLAGYQFALAFDPGQLQLLAVETANSPLSLSAAENFGLYQSAGGELRGLWTDAAGRSVDDGVAVFTLRFRALQSGARLSELLHLKPKNLAPEAYTVEQVKTGLELVFTETTGLPELYANQPLALLQNRPNPFAGTTTIGFVLPEPGAAQLRVLDPTGRELYRLNKPYPAGYSEETIKIDPASTTGVLYYELTTPFGQLTRRMVVAQR